MKFGVPHPDFCQGPRAYPPLIWPGVAGQAVPFHVEIKSSRGKFNLAPPSRAREHLMPKRLIKRQATHSRKAKTVRPRSSRRSLAARGPPRGSEEFPVVGIGASAGGLDACRKLMDALPADNGMAFILVQHLDPTHESMMVDLLAGHTSMTVRQATDGMPIERDHLYVIPPGTYLSVGNGALHLSPAPGASRCAPAVRLSCCTRWRRSAARAPSA